MEWVKSGTSKVPIKSWCANVEDGALLQAINSANHPVVFRHVALMPDCHRGYGVPIGSVIACKDALIPNAVGVDIGCGMSYIRTDISINKINKKTIKTILGQIRPLIPVGFKHQDHPQEWGGFEDCPDCISKDQIKNAKKQLGTLGGGNHFLEIQKDFEDSKDNCLSIMLHSGSRNFGYKIADEYHKKALALNEKFYSNIPDKELAFLPIGTKEFSDYYDSMNFALKFAEENRARMMNVIKNILFDMFQCNFTIGINIHHNFAAIENHFGKNVWVHRKGATQAKKDQLGIIPGSMGTSSYIVRGLGNKESFMSCSHGAGRVMSRTQASKTLTKEECNKAMEGIVFGRWGQDRKGRSDFGEAPQAYKDIDTVIESQADLVEPVYKLQPLGVIKA